MIFSTTRKPKFKNHQRIDLVLRPTKTIISWHTPFQYFYVLWLFKTGSFIPAVRRAKSLAAPQLLVLLLA
jgi:hypothetical protein